MRRLALVLAFASVLAGCAEEPQASSISQPAAEGGVVSGRVVDDQLLPLEGAEVAILAANLTTHTGPSGVFALLNVPPGSHDLVASLLGHTTSRTRVTVEDGVATDGLELVLSAIAPPATPFSKPFLGRGFISCAVKAGALTLTAFQPCEADPNHDPFFEFEVEREKGLVSVVLELAWTPTLPASAAALRQELWKNPVCGTPSTCSPEYRYGLWSGASPIKTVLGSLSAPFHDLIEPEGPTPLTVYGHVSRDGEPLAVVVVQQEVHFYVTAFYHSEPAPGYTLTE